MKKLSSYALILIIVFSSGIVSAGAVTQELKYLIGYTIISSDSISEILTNTSNDKYIKLYGGSTFKVSFMYLNPLILTDVIIFSKSISIGLTGKYKGKIPEHMLYSYKLLINDKIYDAALQK